jgi:hypothetical protein
MSNFVLGMFVLSLYSCSVLIIFTKLSDLCFDDEYKCNESKMLICSIGFFVVLSGGIALILSVF